MSDSMFHPYHVEHVGPDGTTQVYGGSIALLEDAINRIEDVRRDLLPKLENGDESAGGQICVVHRQSGVQLRCEPVVIGG